MEVDSTHNLAEEEIFKEALGPRVVALDKKNTQQVIFSEMTMGFPT